jgi:hypothetical protein
VRWGEEDEGERTRHSFSALWSLRQVCFFLCGFRVLTEKG